MRVVAKLRAGESFASAFRGIEAPKRGGGKLLAPGDLFTQLAACSDGAAAIALLRGPGGLDEWFEDEDRMGGLDQFECEVLEQAERDAAKVTPRAYLDELAHQARKARPSRFLRDARLIAGAPGAQRPARKAPPVPQPAAARGSSARSAPAKSGLLRS